MRIGTGQRRAIVGALSLILTWIAAACALEFYGRTRKPHGHWDAIIVAGAMVWRDGRPSKALVRRTMHGIELFRQGYAPLLVFTGGAYADRTPEARVAAEFAKNNGVPEGAIVVEDRSRTTEENAQFARALIGDKRVLVVTDAYHVLRSELIYRRAFKESSVVGIPLGTIPPLSTIWREVPAIVWYWLRELVR